MSKISKENLKLLLEEFWKWYEKDNHSKNENSYSEFREKSFWIEINDEDFKSILFEFYQNGGKIQSIDHRLKSRVKSSIDKNYLQIRYKILELFDTFEITQVWWEQFLGLISGAGKGFFSILLHRINPEKFVILNSKSLAGLVSIGYLEKIPSNIFNQYNKIKLQIDDLIKDIGSPINYYQIDSLWEYIIGQKMGHEYLNSNNNSIDGLIHDDDNLTDIVCSLPKNLILYGPPGTGKTYNTFKKAEELLGFKPTIGENTFFITFHQSFSYEQFIEGISVDTKDGNTVYRIKDGVFKNACKKCRELNNNEPVVLIIDEINRGNISKIFGELITLIEDDKRLGADNEIIVTLPYSGEQFGVPPNLYIIGTMNTADRSLVQLDTALRRRFDFEEMMPKYHKTEKMADKLNDTNSWLYWHNEGKVKDFDFDLSLFLYNLNQKICKEYDREHQIGHSFLMKVENIEQLQRAWENKIMPLLQEYFYSDYDRLAEVIGKDSNYLQHTNNSWQLNMKVETIENFKTEFQKIYNHLVKKESTEITDSE